MKRSSARTAIRTRAEYAGEHFWDGAVVLRILATGRRGQVATALARFAATDETLNLITVLTNEGLSELELAHRDVQD